MPALNSAAYAQTAQRQHVLGRLLYSQSKAARRFRWFVALLAIGIGIVRLRVPVASLSGEFLYRKDILQGYVLAKAIRDGADPYLPTPQLVARYLGGIAYTELPHPTPHPPTLGLLLMPLSLLDYPAAAVVWLGLELGCLVASVYLLGRALGTRLSMGATLGIAAVLLIWYPIWAEMAWGQLQLPMLALLSGAWVALRSGRPALGGALVGLAILFKPLPLPLLLLLVLRRDWRALATALFVVSAGYLTAVLAVGLNTVRAYFTVVLPSVTSIYRAAWGNISIASLGWRVFDGTETTTTGYAVAPPLIKLPIAAQVAAIALPSLLLLTACVVVCKQRNLDASLGIMVCVSIVAMPISWPHYLVLAAIPGAQVMHWLLCHRLPHRETNVAIIVLLLLEINWNMVGTALAKVSCTASGSNTLPFALAQIPTITTIAVGALVWLLVWLGR